jgi:hypothetical protein
VTEPVPVELLRRSFVVPEPPEAAWARLADLESWPTWTPHIRRIERTPVGDLTAATRGVLRLRGGLRAAFAMSGFDPPHRWEWRGNFMSLTVRYDHLFAREGTGTRLTWIVRAEGRGSRSLGRLFAWIYARDLDRAISRFVARSETPRRRSLRSPTDPAERCR